MRIYWKAWALAPAIALLLALPAGAQVTEKNRAELEKLIPQTVYLRIDLPCVHGKQGMIASWVEPMVEASATDIQTKENAGWSGSVFTGTKRTLFLGFGPNDALKYKGLDFDKSGWIDVKFEGLGSKQFKKNRDAAIRIVKAQTTADFKAALDRAFSSVPLQDEHPEWPEEIRKALGEHRVIEGMTQEQAACVTGKPVSAETGEENGSKVETWQIRQEKGVLGWTSSKEGASQLKFVNGKLAAVSTEKPKK